MVTAYTRALFAGICCYAIWRALWSPRPALQRELPFRYAGKHRALPLNQTLGFERVLVLNLPERVDRRDVMTLMASASDIDVDFVAALNGKDLESVRMPSVKPLPYILNVQPTLTPGQLGCFRSNMNIMQKIVKEQIQTTLILQDDAEWDMDIRQSLALLQAPFASLLSSVDSDSQQVKSTEANPWMSGHWDIFWLGASYERPWPDYESAPYVAYADSTVANPTLADEGGVELAAAYKLARAQTDESDRERLVQLSRRPLGMAAYAVSLAGASKILARLSAAQAIEQSYDNTICAMSRPFTRSGYEGLGCEITAPITEEGAAELRSYSVWPPLVAQFRNAEGLRDSDIVQQRTASFPSDGQVGYALEIKNGVRQAILSNRWPWHLYN